MSLSGLARFDLLIMNNCILVTLFMTLSMNYSAFLPVLGVSDRQSVVHSRKMNLIFIATFAKSSIREFLMRH